MSKIAVIGKGKTGGEVLKLLLSGEAVIFDQSHPVSVEALKACDVAIIFVPGTVVPSIIDAVLASGIPAVWGSTGFVWPADLQAKLVAHNTRWVVANNFSPLMVVIRKMLNLIGEHKSLIGEVDCSIHEVHHIHKKDRPSGTANSWAEWVGVPATITAEREGDVKGIHELTLKTASETLTIKHDVQDRAVFAEGAVWAARYLLGHPQLAAGLYQFHELENP